MKIIQYNKLIRDKIPEIIAQDNAIPKVSILSPERFREELNRKILEEAQELKEAQSREDVINELADIKEILLAIAVSEGIDWEEVEQKRKTKLAKRGGFENKLFLEEVQEQN